MDNKLNEFINGYSDNDGIVENELSKQLHEDNPEQLFESIYSSNYSTETVQDSEIGKYLESPLETGLKVPMYLKESEIETFSRIYEECNR